MSFVKDTLNGVIQALDAGCAEETITLYGHEVTYRLPTVRQLVEAKNLCRQYEGSEAYSLAYGTALWAACVQTVDGVNPYPALNKQDSSLRAKWLKALDSLYPETLEKWSEAYSKLKVKADEALTQVGESSAATPSQD